MEAKILGEFAEGKSTCYLSNIVLKDYISSLPEDYRDYEVQREIVSNAYLDGLINTISGNKHIPPIVLVVEQDNFKVDEGKINITKFKILDGLQRTFRLKMIFDTIQLITEEIKKGTEFLDFNKLSIAKKFKNDLEKINSSTSIFTKLIDYHKSQNSDIHNLFSRDQWFEIWINLDPEDEVNKMLILNAGHKSVKTKHQLELLFRNILPLLHKIDIPEFSVIREKDPESSKLIKDRKPGQYLFSNLITSILSFSEAKPMTTNIDLIQKSQNDYFGDEVYDNLLKVEFLKPFLTSLISFDQNLSAVFGAVGTQWLGRETSLVGMYAALGKYAKEKSISPAIAIISFDEKIANDVSKLKLTEFEAARNSLDLAKINFGVVNKKAVFDSITNLLDGNNDINWDYYFKGDRK